MESVDAIFAESFLFFWSALAELAFRARKLYHMLFRAPAQLSAWNVALASIYLGALCIFDPRGLVGGRDMFVESARWMIGLAPHGKADAWDVEAALTIYGGLLVAGGVLAFWASIADLFSLRIRPGTRRNAWAVMQAVWSWTAVTFVVVHWHTPVTGYAVQLALTSVALHRRVLAEDRRADE